MQLSVSDKATGAYAVAVIMKARTCTASPAENFNIDWTNLVNGTVQVSDAPTNG